MEQAAQEARRLYNQAKQERPAKKQKPHPQGDFHLQHQVSRPQVRARENYSPTPPPRQRQEYNPFQKQQQPNQRNYQQALQQSGPQQFQEHPNRHQWRPPNVNNNRNNQQNRQQHPRPANFHNSNQGSRVVTNNQSQPDYQFKRGNRGSTQRQTRQFVKVRPTQNARPSNSGQRPPQERLQRPPANQVLNKDIPDQEEEDEQDSNQEQGSEDQPDFQEQQENSQQVQEQEQPTQQYGVEEEEQQQYSEGEDQESKSEQPKTTTQKGLPRRQSGLLEQDPKTAPSPIRFVEDDKPLIVTSYCPLKSKNRKQTLNKEISSKRTLATTMCPQAQFRDRQTTFRNNNKDLGGKLRLDLEQWFSFYEIDKTTKLPTINLAIKRHRRSTGEETIIRSPQTLKMTVQHILKYIVDSDKRQIQTLPFIGPVESKHISYTDVYNFLWNRLRAVIIDITEMPEEIHYSQECIFCLEMIARFYFLSINQRRKEKDSDEEAVHIDQKINRDRISQTLSGLMEAYRHSRNKLKTLMSSLKSRSIQVTPQLLRAEIKRQNIYISPHQPQIFAYALIYEANFSRLETFYEDFRQFGINPLLESPEVKLAMEVIEAVTTKNYHRYFQILQRDSVKYLTASCMLAMIQDVRCVVLEGIYNFWKTPDNGNGQAVIPFSVLDQYLHFQGNKQEIADFVIHIGGTLNTSRDNMVRVALNPPNQQRYNPPYYNFKHNKLRREVYGLDYNNINPEITRQELLGGTWKQDNNYDQLVVSLFGGKIEGTLLTAPARQPVQFFGESLRDINRLRMQEAAPQIASPISGGQADAAQKTLKKIKVKKLVEHKLYNAFKNLVGEQVQKEKKLIRMQQILTQSIRPIMQVSSQKIKQYIKYKGSLKKGFSRLKSHLLSRRPEWLDSKQGPKGAYPEFQTHKPVIELDRGIQSTFALEELKPLQTFTDDILCSLGRLPGTLLKLQSQFKIRIVVLINSRYLQNSFRSKCLREIMNYILSPEDASQFAKFSTDKSEQISWNRSTAFQFKNQTKELKLSLDCFKVQFQSSQQSSLASCLENKCYGTDLIIIPMLLEDPTTILGHIATLKSANIDILKLQFLLPVICNRPFQPLAEFMQTRQQQLPESVMYFEVEAVRKLINSITKVHLKSAMHRSLILRPSVPSLTFANLSLQLGTIFKNMQFVNDRILNVRLKYFYYEVYIEECLDQLITVTKSIYQSKERVFQWSEVITKLSETNGDFEEQIGIQQLSDMAEKQIVDILESVKIKLVDKHYFLNTNKKEAILNSAISYLHPFTIDQEYAVLSGYTLQNHLSNGVTINGDQLIDGDVQTIFDTLLYYACMYFQSEANQVYMILPDNFSFEIDPKTFDKRVESRYREVVERVKQHLKPSLSVFRKIIDLQNLAPPRKPFQYMHQGWVNQIKKKRNVEPSRSGVSSTL